MNPQMQTKYILIAILFFVILNIFLYYKIFILEPEMETKSNSDFLAVFLDDTINATYDINTYISNKGNTEKMKMLLGEIKLRQGYYFEALRICNEVMIFFIHIFSF